LPVVLRKSRLAIRWMGCVGWRNGFGFRQR